MNDKEKCEKLGMMYIGVGVIFIGLGTFIIIKSKTM